jgi:hypothetical protein
MGLVANSVSLMGAMATSSGSVVRLTIDTLILASLINVMKTPQHLDRGNMRPRVVHHAFRAVLDEVFEEREGLGIGQATPKKKHKKTQNKERKANQPDHSKV